MKQMIRAARYLVRDIYGIAIIGSITSICVTLATDLVFDLTNRYNTIPAPGPVTVPLEVNAGFVALVVGLVVFIRNFKVMLANGVSRKTFFLASLPIALLSALGLAAAALVILLVHQVFRPLVLLGHLMYPQSSLAGLLLVQTTAYFSLLLTGWLVAIAYYRAGTLMRWILSLAPLVLFITLVMANVNSRGAVGNALANLWRATLGDPSPAWAAFCLGIFSAAIAGGTFLLLRRAPLRTQ